MKKDTEVKLLMRSVTQRNLSRARGCTRRDERTHRPIVMNKRASFLLISSAPIPGQPVVTRLSKIGAFRGFSARTRPSEASVYLVCMADVEQDPGRYRPTQIRTLQRHIARWRAVHGPEQEVIFEQRHQPGERAQSDAHAYGRFGCDHCWATLSAHGLPLCAHLLQRETPISLCFSETFEALAEGIEKALWQLGGVPEQHRTDHLSAAVRHLRKEEREDWTVRDLPLMQHYGMQPTWNNTGVAHENGDVEQSHYRFKQAVDQVLRARGSRDFANRAAYEQFLQDLVYKRNQTRDTRFTAEKEILRPRPSTPLAPCKELRVSVWRFSTIHVGSNIYSVPSRLIGSAIMIRMRAETLEGYVGTSPVFILPRLVGKHKHRIDYHHIIWSKVAQAGGVRRLPIPG